MEANLNRFRAAHTQVLGVSVDSIFCHANWAASLGGISFPLLADFHPKGAMTSKYGLYLEDNGITDRATVIIDASGIVRYVASVTPAGERSIPELAAIAEKIDKEHGGSSGWELGPGLPSGSKLFVKSNCGFSRAVLLARDNLHLQKSLPVVNVTEDPAAMKTLKELTGKEQAPCLLVDGKPMLESADIIKYLVGQTTDNI